MRYKTYHTTFSATGILYSLISSLTDCTSAVSAKSETTFVENPEIRDFLKFFVVQVTASAPTIEREFTESTWLGKKQICAAVDLQILNVTVDKHFQSGGRSIFFHRKLMIHETYIYMIRGRLDFPTFFWIRRSSRPILVCIIPMNVSFIFVAPKYDSQCLHCASQQIWLNLNNRSIQSRLYMWRK